MKICALLLSALVMLSGSSAWAEADYAPVPDRYSEIDARIEALDAERAEISTYGPKTATWLGAGILAGGAIAWGVGLGNCCSNDEKDPKGAIGAGIALLAAGGITAITGGIIWGKRSHRRNEIDAERDSLIEERDGLAASLSHIEVSSAYRSGTRFVTLGVRF